ncbi:lysosomal alpha-glucosidase-like [Ixodes scapularis]
MLNERTAIPSCYFPKDYAGYAVTRTETSTDRVTLHLERKIPSGIDVDIRAVRVELLFYDQNTLRIRTLGTTEKRFVPPVPRIPSRTFAGDRQYTVTFNETNGEIKVHRRGTPDTVIFQTHLSRLVFTEKFLQLSTLLPSDVVYGLGEQWSPLRRGVNWTRHVIFNDGAPPTVSISLSCRHEGQEREYAGTPVYEKRGPKWCLTRGAPNGSKLPRARLNHQDPLLLGHGKATHSQTLAGEPAWLGACGDATHQTPAFTGAPCGDLKKK